MCLAVQSVQCEADTVKWLGLRSKEETVCMDKNGRDIDLETHGADPAAWTNPVCCTQWLAIVALTIYMPLSIIRTLSVTIFHIYVDGV